MQSKFIKKHSAIIGALALGFATLLGLAESASAGGLFFGVEPFYNRTKVLNRPIEGSGDYAGVGIGLDLRYRFTIQGPFAIDLVAAANYTFGNNAKPSVDESFRRVAYGAGADIILGPLFFGTQFKFNRADIKDGSPLRGTISPGALVLKYTTFSIQGGARIKLSSGGGTQLMLGLAYEPGTAQPGGNVPGLGGGSNSAANAVTVRAANVFANFIFLLGGAGEGVVK